MRIKFCTMVAVLLVGIISASCGATTQENSVTYNNHQMINQNIPIPPITWSSRRFVLIQYYKALDNPRFRTCTMVTSRGYGGTNSDILGIAETYGMPVNMSNQVTDPAQSEPDSVFSGQNDQTVFVLRNGIAVASEADTHGISGDCPPNVHPNTLYQQVIDYESGLTATTSSSVSFLPPIKTTP